MIPVEFILGIFLHRQLRSRFLRGSQLRKHGWEASIDRLKSPPVGDHTSRWQQVCVHNYIIAAGSLPCQGSAVCIIATIWPPERLLAARL